MINSIEIKYYWNIFVRDDLKRTNLIYEESENISTSDEEPIDEHCTTFNAKRGTSNKQKFDT